MVVQYEVELRSRLESTKFQELKSWLDEQADFLGESRMKSYLFREPTFLRIRLIKGKKAAIITEKTGSYAQVGRREEEFEIPRKNLPDFVKEKEKQGYTRCSLAQTVRFSYRLNGLKVELNKNNLGLIVEIEALTQDEKEVPLLKEKISSCMKKLNLKELTPAEYQKLMDDLYAKTLKPVARYRFAAG
ncbi:MAG TPA: CYTH domain-containing protein [Candidatus Nanoarchaeia archaeon]|nr:CYTH domain-containing protein [Candidatus Nanoarchaeia archaeon]